MNKDRSGHSTRLNTAVGSGSYRSALTNSENGSLESRRNGFKSVSPPTRGGLLDFARESVQNKLSPG